jgi:hypothetical protein
MSTAARRAAEAKVRQRDRLERGSRRGMRAANRSPAPTFFDGNMLALMTMMNLAAFRNTDPCASAV